MEHPFRDAFLGLPPEQSGHLDELLRRAALQALRKRAGCVPLQVTPFQSPPPPETEAGPEATALLRQLLDKDQHLMTYYWLEKAQEQEVRPPSALLPRLFRQGLRAGYLGDALFQQLGPRGHWLAAQNPEWMDFLPYAHPANTQPGFRACYAHWLELRHDDPAAFRKALRTALPRLRTSERRTAFTLLRFNAVESDVPFLVEHLEAFALGVSDLAQRYLYAQRAAPWYQKLQTILHQTLDLASAQPQIDPERSAYPKELGFMPDTPQKALVKQLCQLFTEDEFRLLTAEKAETLLYDPVFGQAAGMGLLAALPEADAPDSRLPILQHWYYAPAFRETHSAIAGQLVEQFSEARQNALLDQSLKHDGRVLRDILHPERLFRPLSPALSQRIFGFFTERIFPHTARPDTQEWAAALKVFFQCVRLEDTQDWRLETHAMSPFWHDYWTRYEKVLRTRRKIAHAF